MGEMLKLDEALALRERLRRAGETLVFTNGHFDLLHAGHLEYLEKARALGDALFVAPERRRLDAAAEGRGADRWCPRISGRVCWRRWNR